MGIIIWSSRHGLREREREREREGEREREMVFGRMGCGLFDDHLMSVLDDYLMTIEGMTIR